MFVLQESSVLIIKKNNLIIAAVRRLKAAVSVTSMNVHRLNDHGYLS